MNVEAEAPRPVAAPSEDTREALVVRLDKWLRHKPRCARNGIGGAVDRPCNCGRDALVREAADRLAAPVGWQPIETAPKDGTEILGYGSEGIEIMHYEDAWGPSIDDPGHDAGWFGLYAAPGTTRVRRESHYYREAQGQPTHWMSLPEAPDGK